MSVGPMRQSERQEGITGLETAIILIAFVVVASIFAFTVLSDRLVFCGAQQGHDIRRTVRGTQLTIDTWECRGVLG